VAIIVAAAVLWPGAADAGDSAKGGGSGAQGSGSGSGQDGVDPNTAGKRAVGSTGKSPGTSTSPDPAKSGAGSRPSSKSSPGGSSGGGSSQQSPSTPGGGGGGTGSGGGTGGGSSDKPALVLYVVGTKNGSCYSKAGYQWEINSPVTKHWIYVDGDYISGGTERSGGTGPQTFWGTGSHEVKIYLEQPNIVRSVSFTMC
jgi:hypothetical protein